MKHFLFISICIFSIAFSYAQTTAYGYYITQNNDTVKAEIRIRKGAFGQTSNDFIKEVEVVDSLNGFKKFTPDDIKGYSLSYKGVRYLFISKPIKDGSKKFLVPVAVGPKSSLYQYAIYTSGSGSSFASNQVFYTFEKSGGEYLFLKNMLNKKFKSDLKAFYSDNLDVQQLIDTKLQYWLDMQKDLTEIIRAANKS